MEMAGRLQMSALAHVAGYTSCAYADPWNAFVIWCGSLTRTRRPLPADDITVSLYFQSLIDTATTFSTMKDSKNLFYCFNWWILLCCMVFKIKDIVTMLLRLWLSFLLAQCAALVM